jgi:signal transduction histidine kinase
MSPTPRPEAIDSRLVFLVYSCVTLSAGIIVYMWPLIFWMKPDATFGFAYDRVTAAVVAAFGSLAASFAAIEDPVARRRALLGFANAHLLLGVMLVLQWIALLSPVMPAIVGWAPLILGLVLLYLAITGPGADFTRALPALAVDRTRAGVRMFAVRNKAGIANLRSQYEQQIRQAAKQEERARLARDLHDAVKQQLFAIQTAAATAQARFDSDPEGAKAAVDQVRGAARDAMTEMEAMLDQLQAVPIENAGLVEFVRRQCDALGFRTGAVVQFETGLLPDNLALDPGARQALARVAQEALSNVARHARARHVHVTLGLAEGRLALTVKDDGSGFEPSGKRRGMGLANIATRAAEVGGTFEVVSVPGGGTMARFSVPCYETASPRPYVNRAAVWFVVLIVILALTESRGANADPWAIPIVLIAAIAVARYTVAAYWLMRRRESSA